MAPCGNVEEKKFLARTLTGCYLTSALHVNVLNAMYSTRLCVCLQLLHAASFVCLFHICKNHKRHP